jgi:hypothetical protein
MGKHLLMVFSNPAEGKEDEYNTWYDDVHLGEVLQVPGIERAQRFAVADLMPGVTDHKYVAIYELSVDDPADVMKALGDAVPGMRMSDAFDAKTAKTSIVSAVSDEQVTA